MLEVRKNTFAKSYENDFFRHFAFYLSEYFNKKNKDAILIGSPVCSVDEKLQIDALLITNHVVCIIDFKNFEGKINIPDEINFENSTWTNSKGEIIKAGTYKNPYLQLKYQKKRFSEIFDKYISKNLKSNDKLNCHHIITIVCFQNKIELNRAIPKSKELAFKIVDKSNFVEKISDIIDVNDESVNLSTESYNAFNNIFIADKFKFDEKKEIENILIQNILNDKKSSSLNYNILYEDQKKALLKIKEFLGNPEENVFVLYGTSNSGKTFLIPYIIETAFKVGITETKVFVENTRVANNLKKYNDYNINSLYTYIYDLNYSVIDKDLNQNENKENKSKVKTTKDSKEEDEENLAKNVIKIPIKESKDDNHALFIVDEANLLSDAYYKSIDKIFGSGHLLCDFIEFSNLKNSKRKIIFIGDIYKLNIGNSEESPLIPTYLKNKYNLLTNDFELTDKLEYSFLTKQALKCVETIKDNSFYSLKFDEGKSLHFLKDSDFNERLPYFIENKNSHILCYSNEKANLINSVIKEKIIKNGKEISEGDLVIFNNNISIKTENIIENQKIFNGQFAIVKKVESNIEEKEIKLKNGKYIDTLKFRKIKVEILYSQNFADIIFLENFMQNPKAELSDNENQAFIIFLNELANMEIDNYKKGKYGRNKKLDELLKKLDNGEKVKTKVISEIKCYLQNKPDSIYFKYLNSAFLRYGWALTVHKALFYQWDEIMLFFNAENYLGMHNKTYFKWLYTGITRAKNNLYLIEYKPMTPFDYAVLVDENNNLVKHEFIYIATNNEKIEFLNEFKNFIKSKINDKLINIEKIEHFEWQERYHFKKGDLFACLSFFYNKKGEFKKPIFLVGDNDFSNEIMNMLMLKSNIKNLDIIKEKWRKECYEILAKDLIKYNIKLVQIIQEKYKDKIKFSNDIDELDIEIDYNGDGAFSKITATYYSKPEIWEKLKEIIKKEKKENGINL